jgi:hypothetical protein
MVIRSGKERDLQGVEGGMKEIKVVFADESTGYVKAVKLDALIDSGRIKSFLRSDGWVNIGNDPIREIKYHGTERRAFSKE